MELKHYNERATFLEEMYRNLSLCLDEEQFKKEKLFVFVYNYYFSGILAQRMCDNLRQLCNSKFFCRHPFKLKDGYIIGSVMDYIRFRSLVKRIKQFIEKHINDNSNVEYRIIAKISKEEIEKMKNRFKIRLL